MANVLLYYAHPGHQRSRVNQALIERAKTIDGINVHDLYALYPRFDINIDAEQERLRQNDVIVFQFPLFWYSTPSIIKEWCDLVLEYGFAYGEGGEALRGKSMLLCVSAAGQQQAYSPSGYQQYPLRVFLTPLERTATLCNMKFLPPYVLFGSLQAREDGRIDQHVEGYARLLRALQADKLDVNAVQSHEILQAGTITQFLRT